MDESEQFLVAAIVLFITFQLKDVLYRGYLGLETCRLNNRERDLSGLWIVTDLQVVWDVAQHDGAERLDDWCLGIFLQFLHLSLHLNQFCFRAFDVLLAEFVIWLALEPLFRSESLFLEILYLFKEFLKLVLHLLHTIRRNQVDGSLWAREQADCVIPVLQFRHKAGAWRDVAP